MKEKITAIISFIGAIGWCTFFYLHIFDGYIDLELLFLFLPAITTMMYIIWTGFGNKKVVELEEIKQYNQFLKLKIEQKELERKLEEDNK